MVALSLEKCPTAAFGALCALLASVGQYGCMDYKHSLIVFGNGMYYG